MANRQPKYPLGSAQAHFPMCEKHTSNIDMTCAKCEVFLCSQCAKTDYKEHDWKTRSTA